MPSVTLTWNIFLSSHAAALLWRLGSPRPCLGQGQGRPVLAAGSEGTELGGDAEEGIGTDKQQCLEVLENGVEGREELP